MKKRTCLHCGAKFQPKRSWARFCQPGCQQEYWVENRKTVSGSKYKLFLKWRQLIGPITEGEINRYARWRQRNLRRSLLNQTEAHPEKKKPASSNANPQKPKPKHITTDDDKKRPLRLRTKRSHVRVVPGASKKANKASKNKKKRT